MVIFLFGFEFFYVKRAVIVWGFSFKNKKITALFCCNGKKMGRVS